MEHISIYSGDQPISRIAVGNSLGDLAVCLAPYEHVYVIFDRNVLLKSRGITQLSMSIQEEGTPIKAIDVSEENKTLDAVMDICDWLLENGADRDALVLAVGGGLTTDVVGFAASIYKRGVRFAYMPTTLLSQVDAAIGGKTGVNFRNYKNILGVIRQPEFTFLCPQVLESLPHRDFMSGAAEMLKTFIIEDNDNYERAVEFMKKYQTGRHNIYAHFLREHSAMLTSLITEAAKVKAGVVTRDQYENGERRKLNLGHTFAHAIETLARRRSDDITHGEAVAMGMLMAARLAEALSGEERGFKCSASIAEKIETDMRACGLLVDCPYSVKDMAEAMKKDKKAEGGKVHFILPAAVGDVREVDLTVDEACRLLN